MNDEILAQSQDYEYWISEDLEKLAAEVIEERNMTSIQDARIIYLYSVKAKKANRKDVYADTTKISPMYKALIKSDFIVTFYVPNIDGLTHFQLKVLMYHELLHVGYDDGLCYVIPHDVEDFEDIIKEYGIHWADKKGGE